MQGDHWNKKVKFVLKSHGLKTAKTGPTWKPGTLEEERYALPKADLYLDCRGVLDGSSVSGLGKTGNSDLMQSAVAKANPATVMSFMRVIEDALTTIPKRRSGAADPYELPFVILFLCAHGIHRSVSMKWILSGLLKKAGYSVEVE